MTSVICRYQPCETALRTGSKPSWQLDESSSVRWPNGHWRLASPAKEQVTGAEGQIGGQTPFVQGAADQKIELADRPGGVLIGWQVHSYSRVLAARPALVSGAHAVGGSVARAPRRPAPRVAPHPCQK